MLIAHAPSGYILSVLVLKRMRSAPASACAAIVAAIAGAIAPDIDLLYFHLIDHRQTLHHKYFSHWPLTWLVLFAMAVALNRRAARSSAAFLALLFCAGGVLHIIMDSVVGDVFWFAPFIYKPWSLFAVHGKLQPWWLNFVVHWSFGLELAICLWAAVLRNHTSKEICCLCSHNDGT